jgi:hypothetical protein
VRRNTLFSRRMLASVLLFCAFGTASASAQTSGGQAQGRQPERSASAQASARVPMLAAHESESVCGGFIEQNPQAAAGQLVGAFKERERRLFSQGDLVYIDAGAQGGVREGQEFTVVRPRGRFSSKFSRKGSLGVYTEEVGRVRVLHAGARVSVAEVLRSCSDLLLGDMLRPYASREIPPARAEGTLDLFAEPTGKQTGRIVLARDGREVLSRDDVVFIDLGAEDNVRVGDYLTVFRPMGHGTIVGYGEEIASNARHDFGSNEFKGGGFSNQSQRVSDVNGSKYGATVKTPTIRRRRPPVPRMVVGEIVVLRVEGRTATAVITRVSKEVHTGDAVEVQ